MQNSYSVAWLRKKPLLLIEMGKREADGVCIRYAGKVKKIHKKLFDAPSKKHKWIVIW